MKTKNYNTDPLKIINFKIAVKILSIINDEPKINPTNLAMQTGLQYSRCYRYLVWWDMLQCIKITFLGKRQSISLTPRGKDISKKLKNVTFDDHT